MSDRDLIARAIYESDEPHGIWRALNDDSRAEYLANADAVLAALGATGDDVLVALPREYVERGALTPTPTFGPACRAALARGRREPVTVTLGHDDAVRLRDLALNSLVVPDDGRASIIAALDAALGGES